MKSRKIKRLGVDFELRQKKYMEYYFSNVENENKRQWYEGETLLGSYHGLGDYHWDFSTVYEGRFYSNSKDGYATLSFPDNSIFEGLFIKNHAFGPGIFTYANGSQDVGFWLGRKLVRLSRAVEFLVPRLAPTSAAKIKLLQFRHLIPINEDFDINSEPFFEFNYLKDHVLSPFSNYVFDPRSLFFNKILFDRIYLIPKTHITSELALHSESGGNILREEWEVESEAEIRQPQNEVMISRNCICLDDDLTFVFENKDTIGFCEEIDDLPKDNLGFLAYYWKYGTFKKFESKAISWEYNSNPEVQFENNSRELKKITEKKHSPAKILSWNRSDLCTKMLEEIFRYRAFEGRVNLNIRKLMLGVRTAFRRTGRKEKSCLKFLKLCSMGPVYAVKEFLCSNEVSAELMDARGNNGIMFAAANDQRDVIDALLDYGVDANTFNDEGLTPLNLCLLRRLAKANGVSNWETAFLPANTNNTLGSSEKEYFKKESVSSFGDIFGGETKNNDDSFKYEGELQEDNLSLGKKSASLSSQGTLIQSTETSKTEKLTDKRQTSKTEKKVSGTIKRSDLESGVEEQYLFDLSPSPILAPGKEKLPNVQERSPSAQQISVEGQRKLNAEEEKKIKEIDKTIEKLLERGADPNISEVPKPSIHLAIFTKNIDTIKSLLVYGAQPDAQLHANEGLLTPLHVLALLQPSTINTSICRLLLDFDADPEQETLPDFRIHKDEILLDSFKGRTPLQLLCMRPDLEFIHHFEWISKIATMLAKVSSRQKNYGGHSYITLSMLSGNVKLLRTLLKTKFFDPNCILGNDLGTALHVLVSTAFQINTTYNKSIQMCDLLLEAGADPLLRLETPEKLLGTCIDYGYREIEAEKNRRKALVTNGKKIFDFEKRSSTDHLKDHIKVMEYLEKQISEKKKKTLKKGVSDHDIIDTKGDVDPKTTGAFADSQTTAVSAHSQKVRAESLEVRAESKAKKQHKISKSGIKEKQKKDLSKPQTKSQVKEIRKKLSFQEIVVGTDNKTSKTTEEKLQDTEKGTKDLSDQNAKKRVNDQKVKRSKKKKRYQTEESTKNEQEPRDKKKKKRGHENEVSEQIAGEKKKRKKKRGKEDDEDEQKSQKKKKKSRKDEGSEEEFKGKKKKRKKEGKKDEMGEHEFKGKKVKKEMKGRESEDDQELKIKKKRKEGKKDEEQKFKERRKIDKIEKEKVGEGEKKLKEKMKKESKTRLSEEQEFEGELGKREYKGIKEGKEKRLTDARSETFPEKLRQTLLRMFDHCAIDINKFLFPYVVLRDGNLYYRFKGRTTDRKEQYSLI